MTGRLSQPLPVITATPVYRYIYCVCIWNTVGIQRKSVSLRAGSRLTIWGGFGVTHDTLDLVRVRHRSLHYHRNLHQGQPRGRQVGDHISNHMPFPDEMEQVQLVSALIENKIDLMLQTINKIVSRVSDNPTQSQLEDAYAWLFT